MALEIVGHRGASGEAPENTLASINLAWQQRADAVEIDVRLTRDRKVVAFHDAKTTRLTGEDHVVADLTLAELQALDAGRWRGEQWIGERVPTLEEAMATIPEGRRLYVEVKCGTEIVPELVRIFQADPMEARRVIVISFAFDVLALLKQQFPRVPVYQIVELQQSPDDPTRIVPVVADLIPPAQRAGFEGFDFGGTAFLDERSVALLLAENFRLCTWTINDPQEARRLKRLGIHAITTDFPGQMRSEIGQ